jgi:hypothetical protein
MLPKFYLNHLQERLRQAQIVTLEILVWLLQVHKDVIPFRSTGATHRSPKPPFQRGVWGDKLQPNFLEMV